MTKRIQPDAEVQSIGTSNKLPATIADLPADPCNPREIDKPNSDGLAYSLRTFGDISGITFNTRTKQLVSGHQRIKKLFDQFGPLPISNLSDDFGQIVCPEGQVYPVRFVDWDEAKQRSANIAANSSTISGRFVDDKLELFLSDIRETRIEDFDAMLFGDLFGVETEIGDTGKLKDQEVQSPPKMAWVLIGIPLVNFSEIATIIEQLADNPLTTVSATANDG